MGVSSLEGKRMCLVLLLKKEAVVGSSSKDAEICYSNSLTRARRKMALASELEMMAVVALVPGMRVSTGIHVEAPRLVEASTERVTLVASGLRGSVQLRLTPLWTGAGSPE